ncbi:MAG: sulfite exporter TauE/SafE family protein, partial [Actinobacteria bacterium]
MSGMGGMSGMEAGLSDVGLWAAFLLGLAGGFSHCLVMCGPLVTAASLARGSGTSCAAAGVRRGPVWFQIAYHAGRLSTYALLGGLLGLLGGAGALAGLESPFDFGAPTGWLKVVAGALMVVTGVLMFAAAMSGTAARLPEPTAPIARSAWFARATKALLG